MTTYDEWRVTGAAMSAARVVETWSDAEGSGAEDKARRFIAATADDDWIDGPHLHKRTVTVTEWTEVDV